MGFLLDWKNTKKTGRTATYVVAPSNAKSHVKSQADYICDGTSITGTYYIEYVGK